LIQAPVVAGLLPKLHLGQHTPRAVLFAGPTYGGLSLPETSIDQAFGQLTLLLGHLKLGDEIGDLIRSFATHLQLHIGSKTPFSLLKFSLYEKWIDQPFWLTSLWSFLNRANASLDIENHWLPTLARASDQMLMDLVLQLNFDHSQLRQLNACRLYLQVLTVSDISTADGCHLLPSACNGNRDDHRISKLQWPNSVRPTNWSAWNKLLQHIGTGDRLSTPLGQWLADPHQQWSWFFNPATGSLFRKDLESSQWFSYTLHPTTSVTRWSVTRFGDPVLCKPPVMILHPTTVKVHHNVILSSHSFHTFPVHNVPISTSLWQQKEISLVFENTPIAYQHIIGHRPPTTVECDQITEEIKYNALLACSDGAFCPISKNSSHSWVFASEVSHEVATGAGPDHAIPNILLSYRSELGGRLAVLYIIYKVCIYYGITEGKAVIYCNNKSALSAAFNNSVPTLSSYTAPDHDLIELCHHIL